MVKALVVTVRGARAGAGVGMGGGGARECGATFMSGQRKRQLTVAPHPVREWCESG